MDGPPPPQAPDYVGLSEDQARDRAAAQGRRFRVVQRDGEDFVVTADYVENRVNAVVRDGVVVTAVQY